MSAGISAFSSSRARTREAFFTWSSRSSRRSATIALVLRHGQDHLSVVLGLRVLAALKLDPGQLGDAFDQLRDLLAELGLELVGVDAGVLDDVVQKRGGE